MWTCLTFKKHFYFLWEIKVKKSIKIPSINKKQNFKQIVMIASKLSSNFNSAVFSESSKLFFCITWIITGQNCGHILIMTFKMTKFFSYEWTYLWTRKLLIELLFLCWSSLLLQ